MSNYYWNDWYSGWGWFLWFGVFFLFFSGIGNWGYSYQAHRKYQDLFPKKGAIDILDERYARGEIKHEDYLTMRATIFRENESSSKKVA
jgi:putative membrane protein